jgi:predicted AAA+ superfamily ATPase
VPQLFAVLRSVIDERRARHGRFVLLGSAAPQLVRGISESLAGRTAFLDLPPFRWDEVRGLKQARLRDLWFRGGFPRAFLTRADAARTEWLDAYTRAFIERDLPTLGVDLSASRMRQLWTMLAHLNGGLWNASQLAASLGTIYHTVNRYVDVLVLHLLLGIHSEAALNTHPARGLSWEAFVIDQLVSALERTRPASRAYFWRTAKGEEVDLLIDHGRRRVPFEIRLHSAPTQEDARTVVACMRDLGLSKGYVIHAGRHEHSLGDNVTALPAEQLLSGPGDIAER